MVGAIPMLRPLNYILVDKKPIAVDTTKESGLIRWGSWMLNADRMVKKERVMGFEVSTVFLGIDHQFVNGPPLVFQTTVFIPWDKPIQKNGITITREEADEFGPWRYSTWEKAEEGHAEMVRLVRLSGLKIANA